MYIKYEGNNSCINITILISIQNFLYYSISDFNNFLIKLNKLFFTYEYNI